MPIHLFLVDAFAHKPFQGNPAAVCLLDHPVPDPWMQSLANELNQAETAFLSPRPTCDGWNLRWFTPTIEVDLCGHATLASAHILWETHTLSHDQPAHFHTRSGLLTCTYLNSQIQMNFPASTIRPCDPPPSLLNALGLDPHQPLFVGQAYPHHPACPPQPSQIDYFIHLNDESSVRQLRPNFTTLSQIPARGSIITAPANPANAHQYHFISRFFAPAAGIPEDHVTGSAHCALGPYWASKLNLSTIIGYQASFRSGYVTIQLALPRVLLRGQAITTLQSILTPPLLTQL